MAVTSSTGCAGNNAVGKGAGIQFNSLEHEALEDADLLKHQRVLRVLHVVLLSSTKIMTKYHRQRTFIT